MNARPESLADRAVSMVAIIEEVGLMLSGINDIGEASGFCAEHDDIVNDAHAVLGMLRKRAYTLKRRFERTKAEVKHD